MLFFEKSLHFRINIINNDLLKINMNLGRDVLKVYPLNL